jgi:hypothetical protein
MTDLQSPIQAAVAKASKTYNGKILPGTTQIRAAVQAFPEDGFFTALELAEKHNFDIHSTSVTLSKLYRHHGELIRRDYFGPLKKTRYEYARPSLATGSPKENPTAVPYLTIEKRFTLHIHGCQASFTRDELRDLRKTITQFLEENA